MNATKLSDRIMNTAVLVEIQATHTLVRSELLACSEGAALLEQENERLREVIDIAQRAMLYHGWHTLAAPSLGADAWNKLDAVRRQYPEHTPEP